MKVAGGVAVKNSFKKRPFPINSTDPYSTLVYFVKSQTGDIY